MPTVLVVDDIEGVHEMLDIVFEDTEFSLLHAMSAAEGIRVFSEESVDLVLSDVQMPGGDGLRMMAELREIDPDVVTIITTASESREFVIQALRLGAFDFVQKPYDEDVLIESVRRGFAEVQRRRKFSLSSSAMLQEELDGLHRQLAKRDAALEEARRNAEEVERLREQLQIREERDLELRKRQMELEAREGAMQTMQSVIQDRLQQLESATAEAGGGASGMSLDEIAKLEELREQLETREAALQEQEISLQEREANLLESEESLMEKGQRLIELETELEQAREDLGAGGGSRADSDLDFGDFADEEELEGTGGAGAKVNTAELEAREAALTEREEKVAERERAVAKAEKLIRAREEFLQQSESILFGEEKSGTGG
ncbi:MAG: response regulator [Opitutales bacterium]